MIYAIITALLCLIISLRISRNILAPATIVSSVWLFCILAYWIYPHNLFSLNEQFYLGISIWLGAFSFSALLNQSLNKKINKNNEPSVNLRNLYFLVSLISFPIVVLKIYSIITQFGLLNNIFYNLRLLAVGNIKGYNESTSQNYFAALWIVSYLLELLHYEKKRIWNLIILFVINFGWAFLVMSKTIFLNIFLSTLVILLFKKIIKTRYIFISLALIFIFFTSLQLIRISKLNKNEDLGYDFFSLYVLSGMPAFDTVKENSSENYGENTFRFFYAVGNKLGISDLKAKDPILNYVYVNKNKTIVTNVYTTLYPFFKDFGYYGIFYSALVIGFFYGYVYKKVQKNNKPMTITYSILVVGLVTQFMNETTISTLSFIIQILILSHIPYWSKKFVLKDINPANKIQN